ncbi:MAG: SCP2 sterol-binding domain-containing protein [Myxococcota bacterium]|nr:SCP2 sterol-binding domain-containing protein [Myxococcota bacterium]
MAQDPRTFFEDRARHSTERIRAGLPEKVVVVFEIDGPGGGIWQVSNRHERTIGPVTPGPKDCIVRCNSADFMSVLRNELKPNDAFGDGRLVVSGDIGLLLKLRRMFISAF